MERTNITIKDVKIYLKNSIEICMEAIRRRQSSSLVKKNSEVYIENFP